MVASTEAIDLAMTISLWITSKRKDLFANFDEPTLFIESEGSWIALPDTEPNNIRSTLSHLVDTCVHQGLCDALPVPVVANVKPVESPAFWTKRNPELHPTAVARSRSVSVLVLRQNGGMLWIRYLSRLNLLTEAVVAMSRHVAGGIHGAIRCPEYRLSKLREHLCVTRLGYTYCEHESLSRMSGARFSVVRK
ncbi:MAG: hypothetical protein U5K38_14390 [Woeseiaceae bacterium]|nr:hypothetical protein [Woeseiaceae bacterium]